MEFAMSLLLMLGGVGVFMYGMKQMGQGLEQGAGSGMRTLFQKINKNRVMNYGIGLGTTAIIQSSSATSVMTVGLVNADIMTVKQGSGIILGAKVGTTVTAFIFAIGLMNKGSFSVSALFAAIAFAGVILGLTTKKDSLQKLSLFLVGFGMLFVGLEVMVFSINDNPALGEGFAKLFSNDMNPIFLVLCGIVITCLIHSSSAASGIFVAFLYAGAITSIDQAFFLMMGANIGTCIDAVLAAVGSNPNGKRVALFHVLTSMMGAVLFTIILMIFRAPIVNLFESTLPDKTWMLAVFNLAYNFIYTSILLIFLNPLVTLVTKMVKDKKQAEKKLYYIDERLLATPVIAIEQALKEVANMAEIAQKTLDLAFNGLMNEDVSQSKEIAKGEYQVDEITRELASFFIKLSSKPISATNEKLLGGLHHAINDIERVGDYAVILAKETNYMRNLEAHFLDETKEEMREIYSKVSALYTMGLDSFRTRKTDNLKSIAARQYEINAMVTSVKDTHVKRLSSNMYPVEVSKSLYMVLHALQRVAAHIANVTFSIYSDTGSKTETFAKMEKSEKKQSGDKPV